jgi:hypothetical protein
MPDRLVLLFPHVAGVAADLVRRPEVASRWSDESACADMTVGALANHLASQAATVVRLLALDPGGAELIPALEHYRRAPWVRSGHDDEANVDVRTAGEDSAAAGPDDLAGRVARDLEALPAALAPVLDGSREPDAVLVPWQGWALPAHDFVLTRTMEVLVHSDDLAASIGVDTPAFPDEAADAVLALLASVAAWRHGHVAVLRALSRPQRAPARVSAF